MPRGKRWSDEDIERGLQALVECDGNSSAASRATGIPARTLREWRGEEFADEFAVLRREKRKSLIEKVWEVAEDALDQLKNKLPDMAGEKLAIAFGILIDKGHALGGEPEKTIKIDDLRANLDRKLHQAIIAEPEEEVPG